MVNDTIIANQLAMLPGFSDQHPLTNFAQDSGLLESLNELQQAIKKATDYAAISFSAGGFDAGLFSAVAIIKAWHLKHSKTAKTEFVFIGDTSHMESIAKKIDFDLTTPSRVNRSLDRAWARLNCGDNTAAVFLFPPLDADFSTDDLAWIADRVHYCGGLIVAGSGVCRLMKQSGIESDEMIDLFLLDLLLLFAKSRAGSEADGFVLAACEQLAPYLPVPRLIVDDSLVRWSVDDEYPYSIGRTSVFGANRFALLSLAIELQLGSNGIDIDGT
jgi:glycine dehydrogenase subunit 2